jgi:hypothetical protein
MSQYVYDITTENIYSEEDFGLITSSLDDVEDYGQISESYNQELSEDWYYLYVNQSLFPFGSIDILGASNNSLTKSYFNTFGTLFALSSGLESFSKANYIGIGTIYSQGISGTYKLNSFEIPRTYVCII